MKRVLSHGNLGGVPVYRHTCERCGCSFLFTEDEVIRERIPDGEARVMWAVRCPECPYDCYFERPCAIMYEEVDKL